MYLQLRFIHTRKMTKDNFKTPKLKKLTIYLSCSSLLKLQEFHCYVLYIWKKKRKKKIEKTLHSPRRISTFFLLSCVNFLYYLQNEKTIITTSILDRVCSCHCCPDCARRCTNYIIIYYNIKL